MSKRILQAVVMGLLAAGVAPGLTACTRASAATLGEPVPTYRAADLEGNAVSLDEFRGEVVLLNVWATWCGPCRREMPALERLQNQLGGEGLRVVAVSVDHAGGEAAIRTFVRDYELTFGVLHDPGQRVRTTFRTLGVPETFLIGRDGRLLHHWRGRIDPDAPAVRFPVYQALDARL